MSVALFDWYAPPPVCILSPFRNAFNCAGYAGQKLEEQLRVSHKSNETVCCESMINLPLSLPHCYLGSLLLTLSVLEG